MRTRLSYYSCVALCILYIGCPGAKTTNIATQMSQPVEGQAFQAAQQGETIPRAPREKVTGMEAKLRQAASPAWVVREARTIDKGALRSVYFLDAMHGWVGGKGVLYSTSDGGKNWRRADAGISPKAFVTQVVFLTPDTGWIVAQEEAESPLTYQDNHFWLLHTNDGGQSWSTQLDGRNSVLNRIEFGGDCEGWIVGRKYTNEMPLEADDFIFHTMDLGEHWVNVAGPLNQLLNKVALYHGFADIMPTDPLAASVLLPNGEIFKTEDGGKNWQVVNWTMDIYNYGSFFHHAVTDSQNAWAGGYKKDPEHPGFEPGFGVIALKENGSWREYELNGVTFVDILFLSPSQILTCGSSTINQKDPTGKSFTEKGYAVVSYSPDGGATWSFIYVNKTAKSLNALAVADASHVWAVGDNGLVLRLETSSDETANALRK